MIPSPWSEFQIASLGFETRDKTGDLIKPNYANALADGNLEIGAFPQLFVIDMVNYKNSISV